MKQRKSDFLTLKINLEFHVESADSKAKYNNH